MYYYYFSLVYYFEFTLSNLICLYNNMVKNYFQHFIKKEISEVNLLTQDLTARMIKTRTQIQLSFSNIFVENSISGFRFFFILYKKMHIYSFSWVLKLLINVSSLI